MRAPAGPTSSLATAVSPLTPLAPPATAIWNGSNSLRAASIDAVADGGTAKSGRILVSPSTTPTAGASSAARVASVCGESLQPAASNNSRSDENGDEARMLAAGRASHAPQ